jgi:hypothetical protein
LVREFSMGDIVISQDRHGLHIQLDDLA